MVYGKYYYEEVINDLTCANEDLVNLLYDVIYYLEDLDGDHSRIIEHLKSELKVLKAVI